MTLLMSAIAFLLFLDGYILAPILERLGVSRIARLSVALFFVSMGTYMAWIAYLFARDALHDVNYDPPLLFVRIGVFIGLLGLNMQAVRDRREHGMTLSGRR
jgi:hypothetical protein